MIETTKPNLNKPERLIRSAKSAHRTQADITLFFGGLILLIQLIALVFTYIIAILLSRLQIPAPPGVEILQPSNHIFLFWCLVFSIGIGIILSLIFGKIISNPIQAMIETTDALASGNYDARLHFSRFYSRQYNMHRLEHSFNTMASELEGTEMLSSDFINNFSHEFKTPIASIAGFAELLRRGDLAQAEQQEYLEIIASEARRLSGMATNVLNLTKVENQKILSDVQRFNVSEQIRNCILLLADRWNEKNLEMDIDLAETTIRGNADLLSQIWLNLLDNAIKFTPAGGQIGVHEKKENGILSIAISNTGSTIPPEIRDRIFQKFYQGDRSHSSQGYGIGLAIVSQVLRLHNGTIDLTSEDGHTCFTVNLDIAER